METSTALALMNHFKRPGVLTTRKQYSVMKGKLIPLLIVFILFFASCANHDLNPTASASCTSNTTVSYSEDIAPIVTSTCAVTGCHNGDNGASLNWLVFSNFQTKALSVKDRITRPVGVEGHMPKVGTLSTEQIQLMVCWVEQGAANN